MKALTYNQYRLINIVLLTAVFVFIETLVIRLAGEKFSELPYVISIGIMFVCLEMMRWGIWGAVSVLASGLTLCLASGAEPKQYLIYLAGNLAMLLALLFIKAVGSERIRRNSLWTLLYVLIVYSLAQFGRSAVAIVLGSDVRIIVQFFTTDVLSGLFAAIVILIARNIDGLFENQRSYLIRLERARHEQEEI